MGTSITKEQYEEELHKIYQNLSFDDLVCDHKYFERVRKKRQLYRKRRLFSKYF